MPHPIFPCRLLVAEEHLIFRQALVTLLGQHPALAVIAAVGTEAELRTQLQQEAPDLVLLHVTQPEGVFGAALLADLNARYPKLPVVVLLTEVTALSALAAFPNVKARIERAVSAAELVNALCEAAGLTADHSALESTASGPPPSSRKIISAMTRQEIAVLRLIVAQLSNKEIAALLFNSVRTIEGHRSNIYHKTGARKLAGIMVYALENKLMTLEEMRELAHGGV